MSSKEAGQEGGSNARDYTSEIPMFDLEEVLKLIGKIHDSGLETASMHEVAKGCGYSSATSTPFYRRIVAARSFGLLSRNGPELTSRATSFLKPDSEDAKQKALSEAIYGIKHYAETIQKFAGKKLNSSLISNGFEKQLKITAAGAKTCARAFEKSLRFAGFLDSHGFVSIQAGPLQTPEVRQQAENNSAANSSSNEGADEEESQDTQRHTLYLDKTKRRKITIIAPLDVSKTELERAKRWLEFTLLVESQDETPETQR